MGFIRGSTLVIVSVLFFISLLLLNSLFVVSSSLSYDNVQKELLPVIKSTLEDNINITSLVQDEKFPLMQKFCANLSGQDYVFKQENYTFTIPCSVISNGAESIIDYGVNSTVHDYYYKHYDCSFWDCFSKESVPFFLVSQQSKDYWQNKFYICLLITLALLLGMFFLVENKTNLFLIAGPILILSSIPFAKLDLFFASMPGEVLKFLAILFAQSDKIFIVMLIIGLIVLALGIVFKFFSIGLKINEFFSKFTEDKNKNGTRKNTGK